MGQPKMSQALLVTMADLNGLYVVEVTIELALCSYLEEDAVEEGVAHVRHATCLVLAKESGYC